MPLKIIDKASRYALRASALPMEFICNSTQSVRPSRLHNLAHNNISSASISGVATPNDSTLRSDETVAADPSVAAHSETWGRIPKAPRGIEYSLLNRSSHTARRSFRTQRHTIAIAIIKGIHLFLNNIRDFTDRTLEQRRFFHHGQAYLAIAISGQNG